MEDNCLVNLSLLTLTW